MNTPNAFILPSTIYGIRCKANGKIYIGSTTRFEARITQHFVHLRVGRYGKSSNALSSFQHDFDKFGEDGFEVLIFEKKVPGRFRRVTEAFYINSFRSTEEEHGYNFFTEYANTGKLLRKATVYRKEKRFLDALLTQGQTI